MKLEKEVWNKNISKEEKIATKNAVSEHFKKIIKRSEDKENKSTEGLELTEDLDSQEREVMLSLNKKKFEDKIVELENQKKDLEKLRIKFEKDIFNSDTESRKQEARDNIQIVIKEIGLKDNKIKEIKEEIEKLENYLRIAGKVVPGVEAGQENLN